MDELITKYLVAHQESIFKYCRWKCFDADDGNDLAIISMDKIWRNRNKFNPNGTFGDFKAWCGRIMLNAFIDFTRQRKTNNKNYPTIDIELFKNDDDNRADIGNLNFFKSRDKSVEYVNSYKLIYETIMKAIKPKFKSSTLKIFELWLDGHKYTEIAAMTEKSLGTVKANIHSVRKYITNRWPSILEE